MNKYLNLFKFLQAFAEQSVAPLPRPIREWTATTETHDKMTANEGASMAHLVDKLGLQNAVSKSITSKSLEYLRKYNSKMGRQTGVLGTLHVAKPAVCVDLACTSGEVFIDAAVDAKVLQRMSGVTAAQYQKVRSVMMKVLGLKQHVSPRDVCIQFGCLKLEKIVRETLEEYDARRKGSGPGEDVKGGLDGDGLGVHGKWSPRLVGAALTLVADAYSTRIDKKRLITALGIQQREYKLALEAMSTQMHDVFFEEDEEDEEDEDSKQEEGKKTKTGARRHEEKND